MELRVPGSEKDLFRVKSEGGDVRVVYSPLDAVKLARENPDREVVFFGIGFETTAPANAMAVFQARQQGLKNFSMLVSHVLVPPAIAAIMEAPDNRVQAFLAAGHVCSVMGYEEYYPLSEKYKVPIVVTGFEPLDLLHGLRQVVKQLEEGRHEVENAYPRAVRPEGNLPARNMLTEVFEVTDRGWRGIGEIPHSGWRLKDDFAEFLLPYVIHDVIRRGGPGFHANEIMSKHISDILCNSEQFPRRAIRLLLRVLNYLRRSAIASSSSSLQG